MPSSYNRLFRDAQEKPLQRALSGTLQAAESKGAKDLARWVRLELFGYHSENSEMVETDVVPEYRSVTGHWSDAYGRPLVLTDPKILFLNEVRLRNAVVELETLTPNHDDVLAISMPEEAQIINDALRVSVSNFRCSPLSLRTLLASVRGQLLDQLIRNEHFLSDVSRTPTGLPDKGDILQLKPNLYGIGLDLRALCRRWRTVTRDE